MSKISTKISDIYPIYINDIYWWYISSQPWLKVPEKVVEFDGTVHWSSCKRKDYQNGSVLYCIPQLCAVISSLVPYKWTRACRFRFIFVLFFHILTGISFFVYGFSWCCEVSCQYSAADCLESFVSEMTCYQLSGTLIKILRNTEHPQR